MHISLLHTIEGNRSIFDDAASDLELPSAALHHEVRPDLREAVQAAGEITAEIALEVRRCLHALAARADVIVVTCATLGPIIDAMQQSDVPIVRADSELARAAAAAAVEGRIAVLCAVESTVEPNRRLFEEHIGETGATVEIVYVERAWTCYKRGDLDGCFKATAQAAADAYTKGAAVVALAHPWMAPAAKHMHAECRPLDSARAVLGAIGKR